MFRICHKIALDVRMCLFVLLTAICPGPVMAQDASRDSPPADVVPAAGTLPEPMILKKVINASGDLVSNRENRDDGPYVQTGQVTGAGWISLGPGYRKQFLDVAVVDVSAAVSWRLYRAAQARLEIPHLAHDRLSVGAQVTYQDLLQVNYFGLGNQSQQSDRSAYRFNNLNVLGVASARPSPRLSVKARIGWVPRPDLSTATGRALTVSNTMDKFSEISAPGITTESSFLHGDVSVAVDWRDHAGHPTHGGLYRATGAGYSDRSRTGHSFQRVEMEASQYVPLFTRQLILALRAWEVLSRTSSGQTIPFYMMPSLGGQNTLRGYYDYRFHDSDMQAFNAELRWSLFTHLDAAAFADAGKVASSVRALDFKNLRTSYGFGFRVHNAAATLVRLDVGHSGEGWHMFVKLSDAFKRSSTFSGPTVVPFVP